MDKEIKDFLEQLANQNNEGTDSQVRDIIFNFYIIKAKDLLKAMEKES